MNNKTSNNNLGCASCDPAELFGSLGASVYGYAVSVLANAAEAEGVLSETFLRVCKNKEQYSGRGSLSDLPLIYVPSSVRVEPMFSSVCSEG